MNILAVGAGLFLSNGSKDGQRDRYDAANSRSLQFFKSAQESL